MDVKSVNNRRSCSMLLLSFTSLVLAAACPSGFCAVNPQSVSWTKDYANGQTAFDDGNLLDAEKYFRQALKAAQSQSNNPSDIERCMVKLAGVLTLRDKTAEAQQIYLKLYGLLSKRYGSNNQRVVRVLFSLGSILESTGDHAGAAAYYQKALRINEESYGPYSPAIVENLHLLGNSTYKAGNKTEGKHHLQRAIKILGNNPSLDASKTLESLTHDYNDLIADTDNSDKQLITDFNSDILSSALTRISTDSPPTPTAVQSTLSNSGKQTSESSWQQEAQFKLNATQQSQTNADPQIALRGPLPQQSNDSLAPAYKTIETTVFKGNRYEQGEENYKRTIATDINSLGPNHPAVANDLIALAQLYITHQRYADAKPLVVRAMSIYDKVYGADNILSMKARANLAAVEFHLGNTDAAAQLYRTALSQGQSVLGPNNLETANVLNQLAYLYYHQGKLQDASTFYEWALASTEGSVGDHDPLLAACLKDYAQVLRGLGKTSEALAMETRAGKIIADAK